MDREKTGFDRKALFADETSAYRRPDVPCSKDEVTIRFRTGKHDVDAVFYVERDNLWQPRMGKVSTDTWFDYYETVITMGDTPRYYCFKVVKGDQTCWYNRLGAVEEPQSQDEFCLIPQDYISDDMERILQKGWEEGGFLFFYKLDEKNLGRVEDILRAREERRYYVQEDSLVEEGAMIGGGTRIGHFCHIEKGARIGKNCVVGDSVNISKDVVIGDGVEIGSHVTVCQGVELAEEVICGSGCVFTAEMMPRLGNYEVKKTLVKHGASIGANATVISGVVIGEHGMIAAGSVVTESVPAFTMVMGIPAKAVDGK